MHGVSRFYLTTPIYYVNAEPHLGHAYTTIVGDALARWHRLLGDDVKYLTGTDEHGLKIQQAAEAAGVSPQEFTDDIAPKFAAAWERLNISNDDFIRTTEPRHKAAVGELLQRCFDAGDIELDTFAGKYCVACEEYYADDELITIDGPDGPREDCCPIHLRPVEYFEEENYFFRLSRFEDRLLDWYAAHPNALTPEHRGNEAIGLIKSGLRDFSISRTSLEWGIPLPWDPKHVTYVWFDALTNYLSSLGDPFAATPDATVDRFWRTALHVIGKDILRFHAVYWPAFLMAMFRQEGEDLNGELPVRLRALLPTTILAHGWWLMGEDKMSKSRGNIVRPDELLRFGNDAGRYFLLRDMQIGHDRSFSFEGFMERLNADLANGLGNLASRSISMIQRYRAGTVPVATVFDDLDREVAEQGREIAPIYLALAEKHDFSDALDRLWAYLRYLDGYIVKAEPWKLAKDEANKAKLDTVLCQLYRSLRVTAILLAPVMPELTQLLWESLGMAGKVVDQRFADFQYEAPAPGPVGEPKPLFQRIDKETVMKELTEPAVAAPLAVAEKPEEYAPLREIIDYDTFAKIDLRVGLVLTAEAVPKSKKLIKMTVDLGFEKRTILGGIKEAYSPEELVGRKIVVVANLEPRTLMGFESHGMLLAASDSNSMPYLIAPPADAKPGFIVK